MNIIDFTSELTALINKHGMDNELHTPDYILADYVVDSLTTFGAHLHQREVWFGRLPKETKPPEFSK